ncbi:MAG TPA: MlaD family protein [Parvularculaceae bacterium]|nr:MCE family protein [Caulobacterales bacterium]HOP20641.1 MlaD family protein [Amphiplicatus sp.]HPE31134.1 MlaD family protein [Parvularculaceae bacterium]HRX39997.1 MlaD family protein [Parvularculaceae bacterium]
METRAHYVLVGAFVLCAIAFAFLFILWLGQTQREFDEYDVIFTERVSGLSNGAAVRFNGIQKGEVAQLRIDPDDPSIVIARVRVERDTPVKTDTKAELELVGFTGLAVIQFVGGSKDAPLLKEMTRGVPRIKADASGFAAFLEGSGDIVEAANRMLSPANTEAVAHILANIDEITTVFAEQHENLALTIENSAQITSDLAAASAQLNELTENLAKLTAEDAPEVLAEARDMLASARALINDVDSIVDDSREPIAVFTEQGLAQVGPAVVEARRLMRTLDQILREIDRDPRGYLFGESTPEYEAGKQ